MNMKFIKFKYKNMFKNKIMNKQINQKIIINN